MYIRVINCSLYSSKRLWCFIVHFILHLESHTWQFVLKIPGEWISIGINRFHYTILIGVLCYKFLYVINVQEGRLAFTVACDRRFIRNVLNMGNINRGCINRYLSSIWRDKKRVTERVVDSIHRITTKGNFLCDERLRTLCPDDNSVINSTEFGESSWSLTLLYFFHANDGSIHLHL